MKNIFNLFIIITIYIKLSEELQNNDQKRHRIDNLEELTFLTEIDHFRPQDERTVRFPFIQNLEHYEPGGPIFVFINEGITYTTEWLQSGLMYDLAIELNAALITTNHRYFGENIPTLTASFEDMTYLTMEQNLGDIVFLITTVKELLIAPFARVILWGSGYGATIALHARQKFPHLIHGVWASSGIFERAVYTNEPYARLSEIIRDYGSQECADAVQLAFNTMEYLIVTQEEDYLKNSLNLCYHVEYYSSDDTAMFFEAQIKFISDYLNIYHYEGLQRFCNDMKSDDLDGFGAFVNWQRNAFSELHENCINLSYYSNIFMFQRIDWDQPGTISGARQWAHLRCTDLGLNKVSGYIPSIFPPDIPQDYHYHSCNDILGINYTYAYLHDSILQYDIQFGGVNNQVTNAIITNGELDYWFPHAITTNDFSQNSTYVEIIPRYAKSADLTSINNDIDSIELINVKIKIQQFIREWSSN